MGRPKDPKKIEEWKEKIRNFNLGRKDSIEVAQKRRLACLGKSHSTKGKTYEEIFGIERAIEYKKRHSEIFKKVRSDSEHRKRVKNCKK